MKSQEHRSFRPYASLLLVWVFVNALPLFWLTQWRYYHWDIVEAKKLLDYGFWARGGAMLAPGWYVGMVPNPADHNYVNHPFPIMWLYTLMYWLTGKAGVYALVAVGSLAGSLLTYRVLRHWFSDRIAWFATLLVITAHSTVEFTANTTSVAQGVIVWPVALLAIIRLRESAQGSRAASWCLGIAVFLAGQITWFALTVIPALLLLCLPRDGSWRGVIRHPWLVPGWMPIVLGGTLSLAVFIGQIFAYSSGLQGNTEYLNAQMGLGKSFLSVRATMIPVLAARMILACPALWLGALAGLAVFRVHRLEHRLAVAMLIYFATFVMVTLMIPRLLFLNQHGFGFMVFPCAVMSACALTVWRGKWLRVLLVGVAIPSLLFCYAKLQSYRVSQASLVLGDWIAANTTPDEIVFTNLKFLNPPIQSWDAEFFNSAGTVADRILREGISDETALLQATAPLSKELGKTCFVRESSQPLEPEFLRKMEATSMKVVSTNLTVRPEGLRLFKTAREFLWRLLGSHAPKYAPAHVGTTSESNTFNVTLYRLSPEIVRTDRTEKK